MIRRTGVQGILALGLISLLGLASLPAASVHAGPGVPSWPVEAVASVSSEELANLSELTPGETAAVTDTASSGGVYTPVVTASESIAVITPTLTITDENQAPSLPVVNAPADGATGVPLTPTLDVHVSDPDENDLTVTFYGRRVLTSTAPDFTLVALPDTQYYSCGSLCRSDPVYFVAQTQWVVSNRLTRTIAFVAHLGDVVEFGDLFEFEWQNADVALSLLEIPLLPEQPDGTPYGIGVGNHDQFLGTERYNDHFGVARFQGRAYYGDHYDPDSNNNHFGLFSVGNLDFVAVHLEYDESPDPAVLDWADQVLKSYPQRRAVVVSHFLIWPGNPGSFGTQGQAIYDALKDNPNLFLMLCGHQAGEGRRVDGYQGLTVHTLLADYQNRANGGDGWLRILEFSPASNEIQVRTYSPTLNVYETDGDSEFSLSYTMDRTVFEIVAVHEGVASGSDTAAVWPDLLPDTQYEWYVAVGDGITTTVGPLWTFTTTVTADEAIAGLEATSDSPTVLGDPTTLTATITAGTNVTYTWGLGDGEFGSGAVVAHTYLAPGIYTAVVTAGNSVSELTATTTISITDAPVAGLAASNDSPTLLGSVTTLTATTTGGSNVTYTWGFGDGAYGRGEVVLHTYPDVGVYTAVVTASNSVSLLTATTTVTIFGSYRYIYLPVVIKDR
jgi:PKD repeat protein